MKELNVNQLESLEAGKFWGRSCRTHDMGVGQCLKTCSSYIFWIRTRTEYSISNC